MKRVVTFMLLLLALCCIVDEAVAQRRVTPVAAGSKNILGKNENKNPADSIDRSKLVEMTDDHGHKIFVDTISGKEVPDTLPQQTGRVPKMLNPLLFSATVGVDVWDPLMRIFGQKYGLIGFSAELNLHNRYMPVFEAGLGNASSTPSNQNFTYHTAITPYFRIGANYNFLYNSNPDYQFVAGLRFGWTRSSYQLRDVTIDNGYWGESQTVDFPSQTSSVFYMNVLFGLRVKIWRQLSMGWNIRIKCMLHQTDQPDGKPWYIPGYGTRNGLFTGSFSIYYTFSLVHRNKSPEASLPPGLEILPDDGMAPPPPAEESEAAPENPEAK